MAFIIGKLRLLLVEQWDNNERRGYMARVTAIEGTLRAGPVDLNYGINMWDRGPEVKLLGIGGKVSDKGVEVCNILGIGIGIGGKVIFNVQ
jgi:hypothetical protein